tara:strand:+ start:7735 stop:8364 length:630 start_codon:yes stop_codon:yes gene_type:complete
MVAVKLDQVSLKSIKLGPVEAMYGGSGHKAKFLPKMEIVLPSQRVPWKIEAKAWQGSGEASAKAAIAVTDATLRALLDKVDKVARAGLEKHIEEFYPDARKRPLANLLPSMFNGAVQESGDYEPVFKAKLKVDDKTIVTPLFHMETKELLDPNAMLEKGAMVTLVVTPLHVYAMTNGVGVTWGVVRMGLDGFAGAETPTFDFGVQSQAE